MRLAVLLLDRAVFRIPQVTVIFRAAGSSATFLKGQGAVINLRLLGYLRAVLGFPRAAFKDVARKCFVSSRASIFQGHWAGGLNATWGSGHRCSYARKASKIRRATGATASPRPAASITTATTYAIVPGAPGDEYR